MQIERTTASLSAIAAVRGSSSQKWTPGTFVLMGYDNILTPRLDKWVQEAGSAFRFTDVKLVIFGLALILMMRFRPEGILPSRRIAMELHEEKA